MELLGGSSEQEAVTLEVLPASPSATWWSVYGSRLAPDTGWPWWPKHEAAVEWARAKVTGRPRCHCWRVVGGAELCRLPRPW